MINLIRKLFDIKYNKPIMYLCTPKLNDNTITYKFIIHGDDIKEYDIECSYDDIQLLYTQIICIILKEDISKIYYDRWNNLDLISFLSQFRFIELLSTTPHRIKEMVDTIKQNQNIININIKTNK